MERGSEAEKRQPPKLNQCLHGGSTWRHKSSGNQSIRLAPLLTEPLLHHPEIHQNNGLLTLELKEKKQAMSLPEFILPTVTSVSVRSIHFKILIFSLKTNKKTQTEWSGILKSLQHLKMLYPERCKHCRTGVKSDSIWWHFSVWYKCSWEELWKELIKPTESSVPSPPMPVLHWTSKHSGVGLLW